MGFPISMGSMAMAVGYMQVQLVEVDGARHQIAFIPMDLAREGKVVIADDTRWNVVRVWRVVVNEEALMSHRKAWKQWEEVLK